MVPGGKDGTLPPDSVSFAGDPPGRGCVEIGIAAKAIRWAKNNSLNKKNKTVKQWLLAMEKSSKTKQKGAILNRSVGKWGVKEN